MTLCAAHRAVLTAWQSDGVPTDRRSRDAVCDVILPALWAAFVEQEAVIAELLAAVEGVTA